MERILAGKEGLFKMAVAGVVVCLALVAMVAVFYGTDSIVKGAHDAFNDFRHAIGMPCH
jgi:cobalt transporter subunit CbtB